MASAEDVYSTATANREEATRAKEIALQKLQQKEWQTAKRLFLKAQRLCADLEGVANCIVVADVHIIAEATLQTTPYREIIRDYYAILDVGHDVSKKDLVQQYKKRAFQLHPDKNQYPGAEAAFKLLGEAFAVLKDDDKRRKHDIQRHHRLNVQNGARFTGGHAHPHPRQPGVPPQTRGPYAQPFGGGSWLPSFFSGGVAGAGYPQGGRHPPQRPAAAAASMPRDSSGSMFAGYSVNDQGGPVYPGRVPVAANQPGGSGQFAQRPTQWAGMRPGGQPGEFAPQTAGGSFQPGTQPGASAGTHGARAGQGSQPGMPVNQSGVYSVRPGVPLTRPGVAVPQQGAPVHPPGAFAGQPGPSSGHQRPFPAHPSAPHSQPSTPTGPPGRPTGPFPAQPPAPQAHPGVYPGAASGQQPGGQYRPGMAPPGRYTALCPFCSQRYTFPLAAKDQWVRCQRCKAAFKAKEDVPGVMQGGAPGVAPGMPAGAVPAQPSPRTPSAPAGAGAFAGTAGGRPGAFPTTAGGGSGAAAGPSAAPAAPLSRVQQAWDEAVKIRTDRKKEVKREARQQKKAEKKERELELERLRAAREEAKQAKAEEKLRRQQSRDKADAESRAKVTAENEHIPLRSSSKPIDVDSVNGRSANVGNENGLPNGGLGPASDAEDEPLILRRKGKLQKVGDIQGVSPSEGVNGAGLSVNGVENGGESNELENDPGLRKRKGMEDGGKGGAGEGGPEGKSKENEESRRDGLAAGTANGSEDRRKRRRVSYIELSDGEEGLDMDEDVAKRRADKGKAKVGESENGLGPGVRTEEDASVTWEELKHRTELGEGSTAAIEGDLSGEASTVEIQDDPLGEVLPGRTKRKETSLTKLLTVKNLFKPDDDLPETSREQPFLFPARSLRRLRSSEIPPLSIDQNPRSDEKPAGVKKPFSETATGGVNPSPEEEAGPSEAGDRPPVEPTGENAGPPGGDSHQRGDEAGPSDENGHPSEEEEDTIFFDFDLARKETDVRKGEFWALYDDQDSMPRFYARVDTVSLDPFHGTLTWFEASIQTRESFAARLPSLAARLVSPGVGKFVFGTTSEFDSINTFAYRQTSVEVTPTGGVKLGPRCGEVWAMFRPEKGSKRGKDADRIGYNVVLIARADGGFAVTRLVKIPGYRSLFQPVQDAAGEQQQVPVKASDVPLFSHRVLAKKVPPHMIAYNGPVRNVEVWELDLAASPPDDEA